MQGKLEHGIEQIKALRNRLREEARKHLPTTCKIKYQGILLAPHNAQLPLPRLAKEAKAGFTILPIRYHKKAELYPYVRKENAITDRYEHQGLPRDRDELNPIEAILARCALPTRLEDAFCTDWMHSHGGDRSGIYLNYVRPTGSAEEYAVLATDNDAAVIAAPEAAKRFLDWIRLELDRLKLSWAKKRIQFTTFAATSLTEDPSSSS